MNDLTTQENLATLNKDDFTITENGEAFISTTKAADLIGMPRTTLRDWIKRENTSIPPPLNLNKINQLDVKSFQLAVNYATNKGIPQAIDLQGKINEAGAKAFMYHSAGYELQAISTVKVKTKLEIAKDMVILLEDIEAKEIALAKVNKSFESTRGKLGGTTKAKNAIQLKFDTMECDYGQGEDYIPVAVMKAKHPEYANAFRGAALSKAAKLTGHTVKKVKTLYNIEVNQYPLALWLEVYPFLINL